MIRETRVSYDTIARSAYKQQDYGKSEFRCRLTADVRAKNRTDAEIACLKIGCKEGECGAHADPASLLGRLTPELADETLDRGDRILGTGATFCDTLAIPRFRRLFRDHQRPVLAEALA